jgi:hypothetical protein
LNDRVPDSDTKGAGMSASISPAPAWSLGPSVAFTRLTDKDSDVDNDQWTYSFTGSVPVRPQLITLDTQLSFSTTDTSDFLNKSSNFSGTAQLSFNLNSLLKEGKGRQSVALRFSYNRAITEAPFVSRLKGFEIFGLVDLSWPF